MLVQIRRDIVPKRIKNELDSFSASELRCWYKIRITRHGYDRIDMPFERKRRNI